MFSGELFFQQNGVGSTSTITNLYGLRLPNINNTGTITNHWGISQETATAKNYFAGNVGIGTTAPTFQLQLSTDSAAKPTSNTWTISSDERVKTNIVNANLARCNEIVDSLNLKYFEWNETYFPDADDRNSLGFIAQEVETFFPNAVKTHKKKFLIQKGQTEETDIYEDFEDFKSLDIDQLIKCLFGSVKYLQNQVKTLQQRITDIEVLA